MQPRARDNSCSGPSAALQLQKEEYWVFASTFAGAIHGSLGKGREVMLSYKERAIRHLGGEHGR